MSAWLSGSRTLEWVLEERGTPSCLHPGRFASTSCCWDPHSTRLLHPGSGSLLLLGAMKSSCFLVLFPTLIEPASSGHLRHQHQQSRPFLRRMGFSSVTPPPNVSVLMSVLLTLSLWSPGPEIAASVMKVKVSVTQSCPTLRPHGL